MAEIKSCRPQSLHPFAHSRARGAAHLEEVEIDLLSVRVFFLVNRHEQILHIHHHPQQPVNLLLRHILQVGHVVRCKNRWESWGKWTEEIDKTSCPPLHHQPRYTPSPAPMTGNETDCSCVSPWGLPYISVLADFLSPPLGHTPSQPSPSLGF